MAVQGTDKARRGKHHGGAFEPARLRQQRIALLAQPGDSERLAARRTRLSRLSRDRWTGNGRSPLRLKRDCGNAGLGGRLGGSPGTGSRLRRAAAAGRSGSRHPCHRQGRQERHTAQGTFGRCLPPYPVLQTGPAATNGFRQLPLGFLPARDGTVPERLHQHGGCRGLKASHL